MKIQLDQNEIEQAIKAYINEQVAIKPGQRIELAFTAGRGERGLTVDVDITADQSGTPVTVAGTAAPAPAIATETTKKAAAPVERVNGRLVTSTVAKPSKDDGIATASEDVGMEEGNDPFPSESEAEAEAPAADSNRAGKSIFATI